MFVVLRNLFQRWTTVPTAIAADTLATPAPPVTSSLVAPPSADSASPIFIDIETTGLNEDGRDEILDIAIVDADGATLLNTLVRPVQKTAWPNAQAIHGISPQDVVNAPTWSSLLPKIAAICSGKTVVFYNAPFDTSFFPAGFFPSVICAMRRYSELNSERIAWVKLSDAANATGYSTSGNYHRALEDALACRHIWLVGIPALEQAYPPMTNQEIIAELFLETGEKIPVVFSAIFPEQLRFTTIGDRCALWMKDDREEINIYRPGTVGGTGKIAALPKLGNPKLTEYLAAGYQVHMLIKNRFDDRLMCEIEVRPTRRMLLVKALPSNPVTFNPIDEDIYKCFVAHRSGMCEAIGTWELYCKLEEKIASICKAKGGHYYKTKAKSAKFAIIFSPHAQNAGEIWSLQQEGYKVTSFDQAITHFGLGEMWDCPRYIAFVKSLNSSLETLK
jgi:DNA polymerase III epsilon subunit-like protein